MKLVTFAPDDGTSRVGALIDADTRIVDLDVAHRLRTGEPSPAYASMMDLIDAGEGALDTARRALEDPPAESVMPSDVATLFSPVPEPRQMRDFMGFEKHVRQAREMHYGKAAARQDDPEAALQRYRERGLLDPPKVWFEQPIYYKCNRFSVIGTEADIIWPSFAKLMDYELELGVFIGKRGVDIPPEAARAHIFGYTIFNDVSARDTQMNEMRGQLGPAKGKDFDTGNVIGPCLVTADEIPDPYDLTMIARVNGDEVSRGNSGEMHHRFEDMIAHVSRAETIHAGEFIGSGTLGGGSGLEYDRYLSPGDVIELEIDKIGVLRNRLVARAPRTDGKASG